MSEIITDAELSKWSELTKRATPGLWRFVVRKKGDPWAGTMIGAVAPGHQIVTSHEGGTYPSSDGDFIAAAREAMPRLLAEVERLREKCDDLTVNGFRVNLKQLDEAKKEIERLQAEVKRLKEVVAGYCGSGQRIQDLSDDCGLLEESNKALRAEVERLRGERAWQSIETAPRDREVLVAFRATGCVATAIFKSQEGAWLYFNDYHDDGELRSCDDFDLSGWMPLPKPPEDSRDTGAGGGA